MDINKVLNPNAFTIASDWVERLMKADLTFSEKLWSLKKGRDIASRRLQDAISLDRRDIVSQWNRAIEVIQEAVDLLLRRAENRDLVTRWFAGDFRSLEIECGEQQVQEELPDHPQDCEAQDLGVNSIHFHRLREVHEGLRDEWVERIWAEQSSVRLMAMLKPINFLRFACLERAKGNIKDRSGKILPEGLPYEFYVEIRNMLSNKLHDMGVLSDKELREGRFRILPEPNIPVREKNIQDAMNVAVLVGGLEQIAEQVD